MRAFTAATIGLFAAMACFAAAVGLAGSWAVAALVALAGGGLAGWRAWARPFVPLDETACSRGLKVLSALAAVAALVQVARLTLFMADPGLVALSTHPTSAFERRHSCLTAYFFAGRAVGEGRDPFDPALYNSPEDDGRSVRKPRLFGPFGVDVYEYPPPFLLLPRLLMAVVPDFVRLRALWFGLDLAVLMAGVIVVARLLGGAAATRALLLSPLVFAAMPTLSLLQKGNVQGMIIVLSMLGLALLERRRHAAGGALLAYAAVSKLYPGLLVAYLLVRRRWGAVAWTAGMGLGFLLLSLLDSGREPLVAFLGHLPGLLGGQAFPAFRNPMAVAINYSIPGLAFKAKLFDVPGAGFVAARIVGSACTAAVLLLIAWSGRRDVPARREPIVWLSILVLATLCSPFLPQGYAGFPPVWLLTLMAAIQPPSGRSLSWLVAGWVVFNVYVPQDLAPNARAMALMTLLPQALTVLLAVRALTTTAQGSAVPAPAHALAASDRAAG